MFTNGSVIKAERTLEPHWSGTEPRHFTTSHYLAANPSADPNAIKILSDVANRNYRLDKSLATCEQVRNYVAAGQRCFHAQGT